jgi:hypothetical protein
VRTGNIKAGHEGQTRPALRGGLKESATVASPEHDVDGVDAARRHLHHDVALVVPRFDVVQ